MGDIFTEERKDIKSRPEDTFESSTKPKFHATGWDLVHGAVLVWTASIALMLMTAMVGLACGITDDAN